MKMGPADWDQPMPGMGDEEMGFGSGAVAQASSRAADAIERLEQNERDDLFEQAKQKQLALRAILTPGVRVRSERNSHGVQIFYVSPPA